MQGIAPAARTGIDPERLAKSLERLSIYDGPTRNLLLHASQRVDLQNVIGNLDLDTIEAQM